MSGRGKSDLAEVPALRLRSLRRAAWISDEVLLLALSPRLGVSGADSSRERPVRRPRQVEAKVFAAPSGSIVAASPAGALDRAQRLRLVDAGRTEVLAVEAKEITHALTDLRTFLREGPAVWDAATRTALLDFLASLGSEHGLSASLSDGLCQVREALRERPPVTVEDRRIGRGITVERLHRIDARSFYVRGRAWDDVAPIAKLTATSPEGERVELLDRVFRHPSLEAGFVGLFQIASPTRAVDGWVMETASDPGRAVEAMASLAPDPLSTIFADADLEFDGVETLRERHLRPAISRLAELRRAGTDIVELESYGRAQASPAMSLVVPLQRRIDLIEHQLAQFAADPEFGECELLYVLDEPGQGETLKEVAGELFRLYGLPFRIAALTEAAGMPIACNLAAHLARAGRLVLLDGDVLPDRPGWIGAMAAALDASPEIGAVTPKLLFADEAIDQAGLEYSTAEESAGLSIRHRLRGMHRGVPAAAEGATVAAAGVACLMIDADDFQAAGGLRSEYGLGAYEGSDLSRRLAELGREVRYVPEAELYRLKGLGAAPEAFGERYARWLHFRTWGGHPGAGAGP
ncbi:MAG TPA: glycosyltransferase [Solirubrobacterales bacterium]|nr:glycosyltransferase [Solirubrobacterales bacterium]